MEIIFRKMTKELLAKYQKGDPLTNHELLYLYQFYNRVTHDLEKLGERFHFAWRSVNDEADRLQGQIDARKHKSKHDKEKTTT